MYKYKQILKLIDYYKNGSEGVKIIYISIVFSFLYWLVDLISVKIFNASISHLFLLSAHTIIPYIWTLITFPFIYYDIVELLFAAIIIYFSEKNFRIYFNAHSFVKFFVWGNIVGSIAFLLFSLLFDQTYYFLQGAMLGVYSCLFAIISYNPKMQISLFPLPFQIPLYGLGIIIIFLDFINLLTHNNIIGIFVSRLAAAAFGFYYMKFFQKGNDFLIYPIPDFSSFKKKINEFFNKRGKSKFRIEKNEQEFKKSSYSRPLSDEEFNIKKIEKQKQIDFILDKISKSGYNSLTKQEKEFLFNSSK